MDPLTVFLILLVLIFLAFVVRSLQTPEELLPPAKKISSGNVSTYKTTVYEKPSSSTYAASSSFSKPSTIEKIIANSQRDAMVNPHLISDTGSGHLASGSAHVVSDGGSGHLVGRSHEIVADGHHITTDGDPLLSTMFEREPTPSAYEEAFPAIPEDTKKSSKNQHILDTKGMAKWLVDGPTAATTTTTVASFFSSTSDPSDDEADRQAVARRRRLHEERKAIEALTHTWEETSEQITIEIQLPGYFIKETEWTKEVDIDVTETEIQAEVRGTRVLQGKLKNKINVEDSVWYITRDHILTIKLEKLERGHWGSLIA